MRLTQIHAVKELQIGAILSFLTVFLFGAAWIAADIPEDLRFRFRAVDAQATFTDVWGDDLGSDKFLLTEPYPSV